jgi:serine/threonine protein kinase
LNRCDKSSVDSRGCMFSGWQLAVCVQHIIPHAWLLHPAQITDFGLSATLSPGDTHLSNIANGTPFYGAPEVVSAGKVRWQLRCGVVGEQGSSGSG